MPRIPSQSASAGAVYTQGGAYSATVAHTYAFTAVETASGVYTATAADRAGNEATAYYTVTRDALAPKAAITVPQRATAGTISISWLATDTGAGVASYDLESSEDGGAWQRLLTATVTTTYEYDVELGHRYAFRVRATDNVSNTGEWVEAGTTTVMAYIGWIDCLTRLSLGCIIGLSLCSADQRAIAAF